MVSITTRARPNGLAWRVQYRENGRLIERTFRTERDAKAWVSTVPLAASKGRVSNATASKPSKHSPAPHVRSHANGEHVVAEAEFMLSLGRDFAHVAAAFKVQRESIDRACYRAGRIDLVRRDRELTGGAR